MQSARQKIHSPVFLFWQMAVLQIRLLLDASVPANFMMTNGKFDEHLFCLSGASGGSVGNGTYFALLYNKGLQGKKF